MEKRVQPLTREQMINVVERRGGDIPRVPLGWAKFYNHGTVEKYGQALKEISDSVVDDVVNLHYLAPGNFEVPEGGDAGYRWAIEEDPGGLGAQGFTSRLVVSSTDLIDAFIEEMPDPSCAAYYEGARSAAASNLDRYCLAWDFFCLFERSWFLFGMENVMCEMMWEPERMGRLLRAFTDYHKRVMDGFAEAGAQGYFTSDDLAGQRDLLFSHESFRTMYLPLYEELVAHCHDLGMHFWFHTDGAIEPILDDLIAIGVDVLHPMQDPPMDLEAVARDYGGKVTFHVGIDIQYLLPEGSVEDVIQGTKRLVDLCDRPEGGCILAASNGIMPETPLENIEAFLRTAERAGRARG